MASRPQDRPTGGELAAEISTGMVSLLRLYTGRGPTGVRTSIGRDHVLVILRDTLTKGERMLADNGHRENVLETRRLFQAVMGPAATELVEGLTGRKVIGFMSENHLDPDLGAEVFVLEAADQAEEVVEEESTPAEG
jgi:uncharacterized protein YbcI